MTTEREELAALREERDQLRTALASRVVLEQAKGVLAERHNLTMADAFVVLRAAARNTRTKLGGVAADVVGSAATPPYLEHELRHMRREERDG